jgi:UDP-2,3-diacylglucosamine pyrophosphatase LpxH
VKRNIDILVISDLHLGTYGSEADEVLSYLKTIDAKKIVINGDCVDILLFNKKYLALLVRADTGARSEASKSRSDCSYRFNVLPLACALGPRDTS